MKKLKDQKFATISNSFGHICEALGISSGMAFGKSTFGFATFDKSDFGETDLNYWVNTVNTSAYGMCKICMQIGENSSRLRKKIF